MTNMTDNRRLQGLLVLLVTVIIWGSTFPLLKIALSDISPGLLIFVRFFAAALVLIPFAFNLNRVVVRDGMILGAVFFYP
jgi:drug/metabolite transporter (DMT)-like permease